MQPRRSEREKRMTEKGAEFTLETKLKNREKCYKVLSALSDNLKGLLESSDDKDTIKTAYSKWLDKYEDFLEFQEEVKAWISPSKQTVDEEIYVTVNRIDARLEEQVRYQFNHDFSERAIDDVPEPSRDDRRFLGFVINSVRFENGHYVIGLPFKSENVIMSNNRKQAEQRLNLLSKKLCSDSEFHDNYKAFVEKIISECYARKVPIEYLNQHDGRVWYLSHYGVLHPKKKKLRVVFECAARLLGTSLNEQLFQGPNLTNTLIGTLMRFREEEIAVMGDIDSMFIQVRVPPQDATFLQFLWWMDGNHSSSLLEYQMIVHLFRATFSPSCANFCLRKTAQDWTGHFSDETIKTVLQNFYVDDCLKSVNSVRNAVTLVKELQELLESGGFHISKWISNSREAMYSIPISDRAKEVKDLDLDYDTVTLPVERALGIQWSGV